MRGVGGGEGSGLHFALDFGERDRSHLAPAVTAIAQLISDHQRHIDAKVRGEAKKGLWELIDEAYAAHGVPAEARHDVYEEALALVLADPDVPTPAEPHGAVDEEEDWPR